MRQIAREERVRLLIIHNLLRLGWDMDFKDSKVHIAPPHSYDKEVIRESMQVKRQAACEESASIKDILNSQEECRKWYRGLAIDNMARVIETCKTQKQLDLFRVLRSIGHLLTASMLDAGIKLLD